MRMAIHETKRQTDIERRLRLLRRQVYGKQSFVQNVQATGKKEATTVSMSDVSYLRYDLLKIAILAAVAFGTQLVLFFTIFERG